MHSPQDAPTPSRTVASGPSALPGRVELIALMAMMAATIAFSIDAMLPALPAMAADLSPEAPNQVQLVVTIFVLGMGLGTLFTGPLSDTFGRKPVVLAGCGLYIVSAALAAQADSLGLLLAARLVQGLGAAGPRVVVMAIIRDLFVGRQMAQIMSFVMIVFTLVPALAPSIGAALMALAGWSAIFWAFVIFAAVVSLWLFLRLPETLPRPARRPFSATALLSATREMLANPVVRLSIAVQALVFAMLFATISSIQPIYESVFDRADSFPIWFGVTALLSASGSVVNAMLVMRLGMRRLVSVMLGVQIMVSTVLLTAILVGLAGDGLFAMFFFWQFMAFFQAGMTIGNLNAIAMEPMGHIAGMAASIIGFIATVVAVLLAVPVGLLFNGTAIPLTLGVLVFAVAGLALMAAMRRAEDAER
ncbi:multidrug effflux MFS transporter [Antarctobacter heliothermus]|uniref:MFS transporter, DHA1 family, bicyclomycin/chloramphenicol resistance protein n=1 Tax=Antarctobacter heliothermus TaxID=74033 RepID=A0A239FQB3_9RHOB|nr:multidrug effflux MFS transporter [Antarctobacter heliothermus]SNS58403.1 MFS transporter, DHA1 family, bicyclomycin/chloramphenicol resistance protein [Antarctobacter heliothermus]